MPLINFYLSYILAPKFLIILEGDALASPQGRAEDIFLGAAYKISDPVSIKVGYRVLEGGANNDEVRNFSWFNYLSTGLLVNFW